MKLKRACLSLAVICLFAASAPVIAADFDDDDNGGHEDAVHDGVAVPAPAPIPLYDARWYVRADFGYTFRSTNDVSVNGRGFVPFGDDDLDGPAAVSVGFGRYLGDNLRVEFVLDIRNDFQVGPNSQGRIDYVTEKLPSSVGGTYAGTTDTHTYAVTRADEARIGHYTGLVNLYYDIDTDSRFTPYVGVGGGVVVHTFKRKHNEVATCISTTNDVNGDYPDNDFDGEPDCPGNSITGAPTLYSNSDQVETGYGLAGNLMAGVAFQLHENMMLDVNYRFMWMSGDVKIVSETLNGSSTVRIGDTTNHELRAGVRWNIN